jgi:hypothetical protein
MATLTIGIDYRNGTTNATTHIQKKLDTCDGDVVKFPKGRYRTTGTLLVNGDKPFEILFEPGAVICPDAGDWPVLVIVCKTDNHLPKIIRGINIQGALKGDPASIGNQHGVVCLGVPGNREANGSHGLEIYSARIERLSGNALHLVHTYGANVFGGWLQWNGRGIYCDGANATNFYGTVRRYNYDADHDVTASFGGLVEGNMRSGATFDDQFPRNNYYSVYFEQNGLRYEGADIDNGNPDKPWKPVSLGLHGCFFANGYGKEERAYPVSNLRGHFHLGIDGATRWFNGTGPNKQFDIYAVINDQAAANRMKDVPGGFSKSVTYNGTELKP